MARKFNHRLRRAALAVVVATFAITSAACDSLFGSDTVAFANTARVIVTNEGGVPLLLVTSTRFTARLDPLTGEEVYTVSEADTVNITGAAFDQTFDIEGADRFLTRLVNPDIQRTATVHLRVRLDEREVYNQRATLRDAALQYSNSFRR